MAPAKRLLMPLNVAHAVAAALPPPGTLPCLHNISYSHGGYMAAAPLMLRDPVWCAELERLVPHAFARVCEVVEAPQGLTSAKLMEIMENNPVVAAFGHAQTVAMKRDSCTSVPAVELDIYLDPSLCREVETTGADDCALQELAARLVNTTLVAHGGFVHIFAERVLGLSMYHSIHQRCSGMTVAKWLNCFRDALHSQPFTARPGLPDSSAIVGTPLSVFLDVKSTAATPRALLLLVQGLNARGIHVWGVGSFVHRQVTYPFWQAAVQLIDGVTRPAPIPFHIFTHIAGVQQACETGRLPRGSHVLFNGGSLVSIEEATQGGGRLRYSVPRFLVADLAALTADFDLRLGYYVAEQVLCAQAAHVLTEAAALQDKCGLGALFSHGFAYSGVPQTVAADIVARPGSPYPGIVRPPLSWLWTWIFGLRVDWKYRAASS